MLSVRKRRLYSFDLTTAAEFSLLNVGQNPSERRWFNGNIYAYPDAAPHLVELEEGDYLITVTFAYDLRVFGDPVTDGVPRSRWRLLIKEEGKRLVVNSAKTVSPSVVEGVLMGEVLGIELSNREKEELVITSVKSEHEHVRSLVSRFSATRLTLDSLFADPSYCTSADQARRLADPTICPHSNTATHPRTCIYYSSAPYPLRLPGRRADQPLHHYPPHCLQRIISHPLNFLVQHGRTFLRFIHSSKEPHGMFLGRSPGSARRRSESRYIAELDIIYQKTTEGMDRMACRIVGVGLRLAWSECQGEFRDVQLLAESSPLLRRTSMRPFLKCTMSGIDGRSFKELVEVSVRLLRSW